MNRKKRLELPEYWDAKDDRLSQYLAMAQRKVLNTYDEERVYYSRLRRISECYDRVSEGMYERPERLAPMFVSRSHASFMAAVNITLSGALPETYMVLRGALEAALYGYLCATDPSVEEAWEKRNVSDDFLRDCRRAFRPHDILKRIATADPQVGQEASDLYELTIDHGGHPNVLSIAPFFDSIKNEEGTLGTHTLDFLTASRYKRRPCYIRCARVGLSSLAVFGLIFPDIYAADGSRIPADLAVLRGEVDQLESDLSKPSNGMDEVYLQMQREAKVREHLRSVTLPTDRNQRKTAQSD